MILHQLSFKAILPNRLRFSEFQTWNPINPEGESEDEESSEQSIKGGKPAHHVSKAPMQIRRSFFFFIFSFSTALRFAAKKHIKHMPSCTSLAFWRWPHFSFVSAQLGNSERYIENIRTKGFFLRKKGTKGFRGSTQGHIHRVPATSHSALLWKCFEKSYIATCIDYAHAASHMYRPCTNAVLSRRMAVARPCIHERCPNKKKAQNVTRFS